MNERPPGDFRRFRRIEERFDRSPALFGITRGLFVIDEGCSTISKAIKECGSRSRKFSCNLLAGNNLEARVGIEPTHKAFAEPCLTTWLPRRLEQVGFKIKDTKVSCKSYRQSYRHRAAATDASNLHRPLAGLRLKKSFVSDGKVFPETIVLPRCAPLTTCLNAGPKWHPKGCARPNGLLARQTS